MTRVKICGITNLDDALAAAACGADLLGFVFYPPSPRSVTADVVAPIATAVKRRFGAISLTGVFVDEPADQVLETAHECGLDFVQLHGDESPDIVDLMMERGVGVIKGFRVRGATTLDELDRYRPTYFLLDSYVPDRPGGTGHVFDWAIVRRAPATARVLLAGGLTPENVAQAVRIAQPWGVDVSSGVEAQPGRKDHDQVRRFVAAAKSRRTEARP